MFGGGHIWELAIVLILALVFFGPRRLPEIGGALGKGIREFKRGTQDSEDHSALTDTPAAAPPVQAVPPAQETAPTVKPVNDSARNRESN